VLVVGLAVALFLPAFTATLGQLAQGRLLSRAEATPILVGHAGNEFDLVMSSLFFRGGVRDTVPYVEAEALQAKGYGLVVPIFVRYTAGGAPVVGTSVEYVDARHLQVAEGRRFATLGEAVVGASVARAANLRPGDAVRTDSTNLYDLSGAYPLLLRVVGVLAPTGGPDDDAILVDVKTTWAVEGLLHGHAEVTRKDAVASTDENMEASLSIFVFTEITPESLPTFHLHGTSADWPLTGVLVFPKDDRARDQALGDLAVDTVNQAVRPVTVVRAILDVVLRVQELLAVGGVLVVVSTLAFVGLVLSLSVRLRRDEITLLRRMGAGRGTIAAILGTELAVIASGAALLAWGGTWAAAKALGWWIGI
jgi:putative ABC transport system permease protein